MRLSTIFTRKGNFTIKKVNTLIASAILLGLVNVGNALATDRSVDGIVETEDSRSVRLSVDNGIATLTGTVEDHYERQAMEAAASMLDGVNEVRNYLFVPAPHPQRSDSELARHATTQYFTSS